MEQLDEGRLLANGIILALVAYLKHYREQRVQQGRVGARLAVIQTEQTKQGDPCRAAGCIQSILARVSEWLPLLNGPRTNGPLY